MYPFPSAELTVLQSLYNATNGPSWHWAPVSLGVPWNFTSVDGNPPNPCTENWQGIVCTSDCQNTACYVASIELTGLYMIGSLPSSLGELEYLNSFDVFDNYLYGSLPVSLASCKELETLILSSNLFSGSISPDFGSFETINSLYMSNNPITGPITAALSQLLSLENLQLYGTQLTGTLPPELGDLIGLVDFSAGSTFMNGTLPDSYSNLIQLNKMDFSSSFFSGTIPAAYRNLCMIGTLSLDDNQLTGTLPATLTQLNQLTALDVSTNLLNGTLPNVNWQQMSSIIMSNNMFSGSLPISMCQMTNLYTIVLSNNKLTGSIPVCFNNFSRLSYFYMFNNKLTGEIQFEAMAFDNLIALDLSYNLLSGPFPTSLANSGASYLTIDNNRMTGTLPESLISSQAIISVYFDKNFFTGSLPFGVIDGTSYLSECDLSSNLLYGTIPASISQLQFMYYLSIYGNYLSGEVPVSLGQMQVLQTLLFSDNHLSGTFPDGILALTRQQYLNLSTNHFAGTLPQYISHFLRLGYFDVSLNHFSGSISPNTFNTQSKLTALVLGDNRLTGSLDGLVDPILQTEMVQVDVGTNQFTGTLPLNILSLPSLISYVASVNSFSGTLSSDICQYNPKNLTTLILDGMHNGDQIELDWSFVSSKTSYSSDAHHGTIPTCLLTGESMPALETLHLSGNNLYDTLPDEITLSKTLRDLTFAHNIIYGTIPHSFQQHDWSNLDLSFNRLSGTLSDSTMSTVYQNNGSSLSMQVNRLSGNVPHVLVNAPSINILNGNIFSCEQFGLDKSSRIPIHDPAYDSYECGSDNTNYALVCWTVVVTTAACLCVIVWIVRRSNTNLVQVQDQRSESQPHHTSVRCVTWMDWVIIPEIKSLILVFWSVDPKDHHTDVKVLKHGMVGLTSLAKMLVSILWVLGALVVFLIVILMPIYATMTVYFGTYSYQYVWTVSMSFLHGVVPAIVLLLCFVGLVGAILHVAGITCRPFHMIGISSVAKSPVNHAVTGGVTTPSTSTSTTASSTINSQQRWTFYLFVCLLAGANCLVVLFVNGVYVYATQEQLSIKTLSFISFLISLFKLLWGNFVIINGLGRYLESKVTMSNQPRNEATIAIPYLSESVQLFLLIFLTLFNNILAPYLAEAFVSSNCFKYIVTPSPLEVSQYTAINCLVKSYNATDTVLVCIQGSTLAVTDAITKEDVFIHSNVIPSGLNERKLDTISYRPPFTYNYTCSSSLLTAFAYVFIYRYTLSGVVQPMLLALLKYLQERSFVGMMRQKKDGTKESAGLCSFQWQFCYLTDMLPLLWCPLSPNLADKLTSPHDHSTNIVSPLEHALKLDPSQLPKDDSGSQVVERSSMLEIIAAFNAAMLTRDHRVLAAASFTKTMDRWRSLDLSHSTPRPSLLSTLRNSFQMGTGGPSSPEMQLTEPSAASVASRHRHKAFVMLKKAVLVRSVCDFAVMLTFGVLFPPLALVIWLSMCTESFSLIASLGRLVRILMTQAEQAHQTLMEETEDALATLLQSIDADFRTLLMDVNASSTPGSPLISRVVRSSHAEERSSPEDPFEAVTHRLPPSIRPLVFITLCFAASFWSFSLFDTLADSVGAVQGLWIIVVMTLAPTWIPVLTYVFRRLVWWLIRLLMPQSSWDRKSPLKAPLLDEPSINHDISLPHSVGCSSSSVHVLSASTIAPLSCSSPPTIQPLRWSQQEQQQHDELSQEEHPARKIWSKQDDDI